MTKYIKILLCCAVVVIFSNAAYGDGGLYLRGSIGLSHVNDIHGKSPNSSWINKLDPGIVLGAAAGYGFHNFRFEGEVAYRKNDYDKVGDPAGGYKNALGNMTNLSFLINCYYDFTNKSAFTPFVSAGAGLNKIEVNDLYAEGWSHKSNVNDTVFAYQFSAGVGYAINETFTIDAQYRYLATNNPKFESGTVYEFSSHNLLIGIKVSF